MSLLHLCPTSNIMNRPNDSPRFVFFFFFYFMRYWCPMHAHSHIHYRVCFECINRMHFNKLYDTSNRNCRSPPCHFHAKCNELCVQISQLEKKNSEQRQQEKSSQHVDERPFQQRRASIFREHSRRMRNGNSL